jgi:hypothetical protein
LPDGFHTHRFKGVTYYVDGQKIGESQTRPYRTPWDSTKVADGKHTLKAAIVDEKGEESWKAEVDVNVDNAGAPKQPGTTPSGPPVAGEGGLFPALRPPEKEALHVEGPL